MKQSRIEHVVAEMLAEKRIVDSCLADCRGEEANASDILQSRSNTLGACIARLSFNGTEPAAAPVPKRTRKRRTVSEPSI